MYQAIRSQLEARAIAHQQRLASLPLQASRPSMTPRGIARMAERAGVCSPAELEAADSRALSYDAAWGFCGDSTIAGFVDMERTRR